MRDKILAIGTLLHDALDRLNVKDGETPAFVLLINQEGITHLVSNGDLADAIRFMDEFVQDAKERQMELTKVGAVPIPPKPQ